MCAIAINALYTALLRRGTTRQLARAIVSCVFSALLLLPAIVWYQLRFGTQQTSPTLMEVQAALIYVALWGWLLPLGATTSYCLFALPRTSTSSLYLPVQKRTTRANSSTALTPPRRQPGVEAPYVFSDDTPWGWLEYRGGRFQGQRLALHRSIATIGREENNDIWLDDDMASRYHAELAWDKGQVYLTDCESLNGVLLNGQRIRNVALVNANDLIEVGSHHFVFILAETKEQPTEQSDPLAYHTWHSILASPHQESSNSTAIPATKPLERGYGTNLQSVVQLAFATPAVPTSDMAGLAMRGWQDTAEIQQAAPNTPVPTAGAILISDGELMGRLFLLDRPVIAVGRGMESDIMIEDASISRRHVLFSHQPNGDFVQDLSSRNGTKVNEAVLTQPQLLKPGDKICIGNISLQYVPFQYVHTVPLQHILTPQHVSYSISGPMPLRLPSRPPTA